MNSNNKLRISKYESELWNKAKVTYDTTKRKCKGVLKAFKKFRYKLYKVYFILKTNANVLVAQFNRAAIDLLKALLTR